MPIPEDESNCPGLASARCFSRAAGLGPEQSPGEEDQQGHGNHSVHKVGGNGVGHALPVRLLTGMGLPVSFDLSTALLLADEATAARHGLTPRAHVLGMGPAPATRKLLALTGLILAQMDVIDLNEAFAAQGLAVLQEPGLADDDVRVNPDGGATAPGHPPVCTVHHMCIGVGQGIAVALERI
jgi:acetyl-CoA acetyltransferase